MFHVKDFGSAFAALTNLPYVTVGLCEPKSHSLMTRFKTLTHNRNIRNRLWANTLKFNIIQAVRWEGAMICPGPCTLHAAAQIQPIHALRLACGAQCALLPVAVGVMNIHDVCDRPGFYPGTFWGETSPQTSQLPPQEFLASSDFLDNCLY